MTVENVRYDTSTHVIEFDVVNGTGKDVTALAVQFASAGGQTSGQQYDFLPGAGLEGEFSVLPSDPRVHIGAIRSSRQRRFQQRLSAPPASVRVVAVIYGDGATAVIRMGITPSFKILDNGGRRYAEWSQKRCAGMFTSAADAIEVRRKDPKTITDSVVRILEKRLQALAKSRIS